MAKRLWILLSSLWSGVLVLTLCLGHSEEVSGGAMFWLLFPWIAGPALVYGLRFILRGSWRRRVFEPRY